MRLVFIAAFTLCSVAASSDDHQFNGRWDITSSGPSPRAWWLEVSGAGSAALKGKFAGNPVGLLEEIPKLSIADGELRFALEGRYHREHNLEKGLFWARYEDGRLKGTFEIEGDPSSYLEWFGVRAPALPDKDDSTWKRGDPVNLFNGKDLAGWQPVAPAKTSGWTVKDGLLTNSPNASNIVSDKKFSNFALEVEYRVGQRGNSGILLRGRYEVQIADDNDRPVTNRSSGGILSRIAPTLNAAKGSGEWQALALRLIGRQVTVVLNGIRVIDKQVIEGPTGAMLDANENDPGPIMIQGDRGPIEFRKIVAYPLTKQLQQQH